MDEQEAYVADGFESIPISCQHHWMIEAPSGPTSTGVCKKCGEEREFRNSLPDPPRDDDAFSHFYGRNTFMPRVKVWDMDRDPSYATESYE